MLANPQIRYIADSLERIRTNKVSLRNSAISGLSSGGFTSKTQITNVQVAAPKAEFGQILSQPVNSTGLDAVTANRLISALEKFEKKKLVVYTELIKKDLETLDSINKKREL